MKTSYNWLQEYFDTPLPAPEKVAELLTFHAFEIEGVEGKGDDTMIDVDVLANRGSDCLCHRGIAKELAVIQGLPFMRDPLQEAIASSTTDKIEARIEASDLVNRFSLAYVTGVTVGPSPDWLRERLATIGQKSINNVVDATNYVMFNLGQPLHAFDANKLAGEKKGIAVRTAQVGEKITTLTNDEYELGPDTLLIVDGTDDTPLGIAGIKGGKHAEVDATTTDIILEAANFNYISIRKTSQRLKLSTDASVRFQNQPAQELTLFALRDVVKLITEIAGGAYQGGVDWWPTPPTQAEVPVSLPALAAALGVTLQAKDVEHILDQFQWTYRNEQETYYVTTPFERKDIRIAEDLIEEIGRIYGYSNLASKELAPDRVAPSVNKEFYYTMILTEVLTAQGFSEVLTYTLREKGAVGLQNALAADKSCMRENLVEGMRDALARNTYNAPLLGLSQVRLFEIGTVWKGISKEGVPDEVLTLALGVAFPKKVKGATPEAVLNETLAALGEALGVALNATIIDGVAELNLAELIARFPEPTAYGARQPLDSTMRYQPFSVYPFVLRDIAVWVPEGVTPHAVETLISESAGSDLVRLSQFDEFQKDGKTSFAFHLVFQSPKRTLSDEEVNQSMDRVTKAMQVRDWEVR